MATPRRPASPPSPAIPEGQRLWVLDVPYTERGNASASGARWDSAIRRTVFIGPELPHGLTPYASRPFSWERWCEDDLNATTGEVPALTGHLVPRGHQVEAVNAIMRAARAGARGFLLADDVGLGKTVSAWQSVLALRTVRPVRRVLVASPLAVVPHWRRTIADIGAPGMRVCVINYDRLKTLLSVPDSAKTAKRKSTQNRRTAREGQSLVDWDVVILDESHLLRNRQSQRSQAAFRMAGYTRSRDAGAPFTLWLSATAGHDPTELSYLAPLLAQATGSRASALNDFGPWLQQQHFHVAHDPRFDKWTWTEDPGERTADIARMRSLLFTRPTPLAMRRLPTDIAGWPEVQRILLPVELSPPERALYEQAWTQFRREMHLARRGGDPKAGMVARLRFRQKSSLLRIGGTADHARDLLNNGHQVAISCQFLETVDQIRDSLTSSGIPVAVMDGRDPQGREGQRLAFQAGRATVVLFTPVEGFSLHAGELLADGSRATTAPRSLIVHDQRYSGIEQAQLDGRCHRDGQAALVYLAYGVDTVEQDVVQVLLRRMDGMKGMLGDETETIRQLQAALDPQ